MDEIPAVALGSGAPRQTDGMHVAPGAPTAHAPTTRRRRVRGSLVPLAATVVAVVLVAAACSSSTSSSATGGTAPAAGGTAVAASGYTLDGTLKLNQIQALGSHNSYHQRTPKVYRDKLDSIAPGITAYWDYEQPPLDVQFDEGVRQIEIDVHLDPDGRYALRRALPLVGLPADAPAEMKQPGLKVFHVQELDFASSCLTFKACLRTVKQWSDSHPGHVPIMVLVEAKQDKVPDPFALGFAQAVPFDAAGLDQIDDEIRTVFDDRSMITPDQVRGNAPTLEAAVLAGGWPTLGQARGRVLFTMDNEDLTAPYVVGHPSLQGRVMFANSQPGTPEAAFVKRNDVPEQAAEITDLVRRGYVVRTRSDSDTKEAKANDMSTATSALASGATWVSTDFPVPDPAISPTYAVTIPGGTPARCNPVNAPPTCTSADIENPQHLTTR